MTKLHSRRRIKKACGRAPNDRRSRSARVTYRASSRDRALSSASHSRRHSDRLAPGTSGALAWMMARQAASVILFRPAMTSAPLPGGAGPERNAAAQRPEVRERRLQRARARGRDLVVPTRRAAVLLGDLGGLPAGSDVAALFQATQDGIDGAARQAGGVHDVEPVADAVADGLEHGDGGEAQPDHV